MFPARYYPPDHFPPRYFPGAAAPPPAEAAPPAPPRYFPRRYFPRRYFPGEFFPPPPSAASRLLDAVADLAAAATPDVPTERVYPRAVLDYVRDRDGLPAVLVAWTPGRAVARRKTISKEVVVYPVTAILVDAQGGTVTAGEGWRSDWPGQVWEAIDADGLSAVPGVGGVDPDAEVVLDLSAFEQAGLWRSSVSILVTVRRPL